MAKAPPSFDFYYNDWLGGTAAFSNVEYACYHRLLIYQWQNGHIPVKKVQRMNLCQIIDVGQWDGIWETISEKFESVYGADVVDWNGNPETQLFVNMRMHKDRNDKLPKYHLRVSTAKKNGKKGGRPTKPKRNPEETQIGTQTKPSSGRGKGEGSSFKSKKERHPFFEQIFQGIDEPPYADQLDVWFSHACEVTHGSFSINQAEMHAQDCARRDEKLAILCLEIAVREGHRTRLPWDKAEKESNGPTPEEKAAEDAEFQRFLREDLK